MKILVCNVGSTSLKYRLFAFDEAERTLAEGKMERVGAQSGAWTHKGRGRRGAKADHPDSRLRNGHPAHAGCVAGAPDRFYGAARLHCVQGGACKGRHRRAAARRGRARGHGGVQHRCAQPQPAVYRRDSASFGMCCRIPRSSVRLKRGFMRTYRRRRISTRFRSRYHASTPSAVTGFTARRMNTSTGARQS